MGAGVVDKGDQGVFHSPPVDTARGDPVGPGHGDVVAAQLLLHPLLDEPGEGAHVAQDDGDHRQHQVAQPVPHPPGKQRGGPRRGQNPQLDGE